jgi:hypothetical protein
VKELDARRVERLRLELDDEEIELPADEELVALVLAELDYARHPHAHEGVPPRYGAVLSSTEVLTPERVGPVEHVDVGAVPIAVVRRLADGRSSFVARVVAGPVRLTCFERTREYESSAVHLTESTGAVVVQRLQRGWVRMCTPHGVATWDGMRWSSKPLASDVAEQVAGATGAPDREVLVNLLEFCMHWLGAGRVGGTLVWRLSGEPRQLTQLGFGAAVDIPALDLRRRAHFAPLLNALAQYDRAALVDPNGLVSVVGVHLRSSAQSRQALLPYRGTRHTSALRFSSDEPSAAVFVVSSNGSLSVFWQGRRLDTY